MGVFEPVVGVGRRRWPSRPRCCRSTSRPVLPRIRLPRTVTRLPAATRDARALVVLDPVAAGLTALDIVHRLARLHAPADHGVPADAVGEDARAVVAGDVVADDRRLRRAVDADAGVGVVGDQVAAVDADRGADDRVRAAAERDADVVGMRGRAGRGRRRCGSGGWSCPAASSITWTPRALPEITLPAARSVPPTRVRTPRTSAPVPSLSVMRLPVSAERRRRPRRRPRRARSR